MMAEFSPDISDLVAQCKDDWGEPKQNLNEMINTGFGEIDGALYGIQQSDLIVIQGLHKSRKTTFMMNLLFGMMRSGLGDLGHGVVVDSLESGMNPKRYRDSLIAMVATERLMAKYFRRTGSLLRVTVDNLNAEDELTNQLHMNPDFLMFRDRTKAQYDAIEEAMYEVARWPLRIYGARSSEGYTRNTMSTLERWEKLYDDGFDIFVTDHFQQLSWQNRSLADYAKQETLVPLISDLVTKLGAVWVCVSQVSLGSVRDMKAGVLDSTIAKGGGRLAAEANAAFELTYNGKVSPWKLRVGLVESRRGGNPVIECGIEPYSGYVFHTKLES